MTNALQHGERTFLITAAGEGALAMLSVIKVSLPHYDEAEVMEATVEAIKNALYLQDPKAVQVLLEAWGWVVMKS